MGFLFMRILLSISLILGAILSLPAEEPDFSQAKLWKKNATPSSSMTISRNTAEDALQFEVKFKPGTDFWAYPEFKLPQGIPRGKKYLVFEAKLDQQEPAGGCKYALVMFGYKGGIVAWSPSPHWQTVVIDLDANKINRAAVKCLRIGANPQSPQMTLTLRNIKFLEQLPKKDGKRTAELIHSTAPAMLFIDEEPLQFTVSERVPDLSYEILNYHDEIVAKGPVPESGSFILPRLPRGYYRIILKAPKVQFHGAASFSVIPDPDRRRQNPDSPYSMDAALSVIGTAHVYQRGDKEKSMRFFVNLARMAGVTVARERTHQDLSEKVKGVYDWNFYGLAPKLFSEAGIALSSTWHNFAFWAREKGHKYTYDLMIPYQFAQQLAKNFHNQIKFWEFWNEPEYSFWDGTAWEFASTTKAAYLGFKAGDPEILVTNGSFCFKPEEDWIAMETLQNDLAGYCDIFNIHIYHPMKEYPQLVRGWKKLQQQHGMSALPLWVTETGTYAEGVPEDTDRYDNRRVLSHEQEMIWAEFVPKNQILLQSLGVARTFTFVLPPMHEFKGMKAWGLIRYDYTASPAFTAFATLTDQLSNAEYLGELDFGAGIRAFLFQQPDSTKTIAFWSESELDKLDNRPNGIRPTNKFLHKISLSENQPVRLTDIFGTTRILHPRNGKIETASTRYPAYLSGITSPVPVKKQPVKAVTGKTSTSNMDKTIVLRIVPDEKFLLNTTRSNLIIPWKAKQHPLKLQIINFSKEKKQGKVTVEGGTLNGLPAELAIGPFETKEIEFSLPSQTHTRQYRFRFGGVFNHRAISQLSLPVIQYGEISNAPLFAQANKPEKWRKNSSGSMNISWDAKEKAVRFDVEFSPGGARRVYPELLIPGGLPADTIGISFDIKSNLKAKPQNSFVMLVKDQQKQTDLSHKVGYTPSLGKWQENFIGTANLTPQEIHLLRIGMNPTTDKVTFWIRDLRLHRTVK